MLTVTISINAEPIFTRTVVNRIKEVGKYVCDDGSFIEHDPEDGAVALAIKALKTIHDKPDKVIADKQVSEDADHATK
jgi:hypothetical protein